jgi:hypothetical protein
VPTIPDPDGLLESLLGAIFGPASFVVVLYLTIKAITAWYGTAQKAIEFGRSAHAFATHHLDRISRHPRGYRVLGVTMTVAMVFLQLVWGYLVFVVGNVLSRVAGLSPDVDLSTLTVRQFIAGLTWDWISGAYVLLCAALLLRAFRNRDHNGTIATLLALPAYPVALFGTLGATLILLDHLGVANVYSNVFTTGQVVLAYAIGAVAISYIFATRAALLTPALLAGYWTRPVLSLPLYR